MKPQLIVTEDPQRGRLEYPFIRDDGGRSETDKKPKHNGDCAFRALATATGTTYEQAFAALLEDGLASNRFSGARLDCFAHALQWDGRTYHGFILEWIPFPAVKGQTRMNPSIFCAKFKGGRYICRTAGHVFAVVDGVLHDTWVQRTDRCIYGAWKVVAA